MAGLPNLTAFYNSLRLVLPVPITYRPAAGGEVELVAVRAGEFVVQTVANRFARRVQQDDLLILASELLIDDVVVRPQQGDLLDIELEGMRCTYKVLSEGGEPCWAWHDQGHVIMKVHTKQIGEEAIE